MKRILVTLVVQREGKQYVSKCVELGTASCGDTEKEAFDNIIDATQLYLNTLEELGECEQALRDKGVAITEVDDVSVGPPLECPRPPAIVRPASFPLRYAYA